MKRATIKDIGKVAGVNPSTVSRALNDSKDISETSRNKIKAIAKELNYVPNLLAVNLRNQRSNLLGLIIPKFSNYFIPSLIEGITKEVNKHGYKLVILSSEESVDKEAEHIQFCCNAGVDGILMSLTQETANLDHLQFATDKDVPILLFDNVKPNMPFDKVILNDKEIGEKALAFMQSKKCKNILGIYAHENQAISSERKQGFEKNIPKNIKYQSINCTDGIIDETNDIKKILTDNPKIDGVFCMNDEMLILAHMSIIRTYPDTKEILLVAISDGVLPNFLNRDVYYYKNSGKTLGEDITQKILKTIQDKDTYIDTYFREAEGILKNVRF
jgi:LacI family transcriptional regulator